MSRFRARLVAVALGGVLSAARPATADRRADAARLPAPLRALLSRFLVLEPERPQPALEEEFDAEEIDRARASRRAERDRATASGGAARDARRASAPSNP